jgi:hypothetical protein
MTTERIKRSLTTRDLLTLTHETATFAHKWAPLTGGEHATDNNDHFRPRTVMKLAIPGRIVIVTFIARLCRRQSD